MNISPVEEIPPRACLCIKQKSEMERKKIMKRMKRTAALLLALIMTMMMTINVSAAGEGTITISGVSDQNVYTIYQLLDLESYSADGYSYKVNSAWKDFFETSDAKEYISVDADGYVAWNAADENDATVAAFAKLALAYAKDKGIAPVQSSKDGDMSTVLQDGKMHGTFENLNLGYYLVDSTMGALCGLTTTNPKAYINAKNAAPSIDKQVKEDSTNNWGGSNTADIGQIVEFHVTIDVHAGAESFILHDTMSNGLTFKGVTKVEHIIPGLTEADTDIHEATLGTDYTVVDKETDHALDCTFEVRFSQAFCDHLRTNDKIVVYYQAMLNRNAVIAGEGNENKAQLEFGEEHFTTPDTTQTFTYAFDLVKTDGEDRLINGAGFRIYDHPTDGNEIDVVPLMEADNVTPVLDDKGNPIYRRARTDEDGVEIMVKDGKVRLVGFDNGTYYLQETTTPAGYNNLSGRKEFTISGANLDATISAENILYTGTGVHVVNKTGNKLPETGGMGTTLFITFGAIAVLGTGVLLVTKKRMGMIQD